MYKIRYGLGGGFGGCGEWEDSKATTEDVARAEAYMAAMDVYDSYAGMYGLRTINDIMEEDGCSEEVAEATYLENVDSWLAYEVRRV